MTIKFYNTMTRQLEEFRPLKQGVVAIYNCGLTVYDYAHIGNLRTFTMADVLRRWLEYRGYKVRQIQNFTDVGHLAGDADVLAEDKMAIGAKREKKTVWEIADYYIKAAMEDFRRMNFLEPEVRPRATEHIPEIIALIQKLIDSDYAYVVNGSVYFDISKFKDYGKLSHNPIEQLMAGAGGRVEQNPDKRSQLDFALWIADPQHVMKWESPWSIGYPGWHIECSVMSMKYLGPTIDIHTGGEDNMFPHHECEIAQSEAANGRQFVRYWMHPLHLLVNGEKMSKSKGNFYTLRDLIAKGYSARDFRYVLLSAHYRDNMNFTFQSLDAAKKTVDGLVDFIDRLSEIKTEATWSEELHNAVFKAKEEFEMSMDNDLNTPKALAAVHDLMRATNRAIDAGTASEKNVKEVKEMMQKFDSVLGVLEHEKKGLPPELQGLFDAREAARKNKDFKAADRIRAELAEKGVILEDQPTGTRWRWGKN